jgi:hypothetical protein
MNSGNISVIDTLNNMYNHNIRLIEHLYFSNNEIRNAIVNLGNNIEYHNNVRQNNTNNSNRNNSNSNNSNNNNQRHRRRPGRSNSNNFDRSSNNIQRIYRTLGDNNSTNSQLVDEIIYIPALNSTTNDRSNTSTTNETTSFIRNFFDPIAVSPSQYQIELATRIVRYGDIVRPINTSCPISLENFTDDDSVTVIRHCSHIFNTRGINSWFRSNCKCPICRYDIRSYISHTTDTSNNSIVMESNNLPNINSGTSYDPMTLDRFLSQGSFDAQNLLSFIIDNSNNIVDSISDANSHTLSFNFTNS